MWTCPKCGRELTRKDQQHYCLKPQSVDAYISLQDASVRPRLETIRETIRAAVPEAQEKISWSMPTYWKGRNIIHFAASKKHIGLYPGDEATSASIPATKPSRPLRTGSPILTQARARSACRTTGSCRWS